MSLPNSTSTFLGITLVLWVMHWHTLTFNAIVIIQIKTLWISQINSEGPSNSQMLTNSCNPMRIPKIRLLHSILNKTNPLTPIKILLNKILKQNAKTHQKEKEGQNQLCKLDQKELRVKNNLKRRDKNKKKIDRKCVHIWSLWFLLLERYRTLVFRIITINLQWSLMVEQTSTNQWEV